MKKYDVFLFDGACTIVKKGVYLFNKNKTRSTEAGFAFLKMLFNCMFHCIVHICRMFIGFIP